MGNPRMWHAQDMMAMINTVASSVKQLSYSTQSRLGMMIELYRNRARIRKADMKFGMYNGMNVNLT